MDLELEVDGLVLGAVVDGGFDFYLFEFGLLLSRVHVEFHQFDGFGKFYDVLFKHLLLLGQVVFFFFSHSALHGHLLKIHLEGLKLVRMILF